MRPPQEENPRDEQAETSSRPQSSRSAQLQPLAHVERRRTREHQSLWVKTLLVAIFVFEIVGCSKQSSSLNVLAAELKKEQTAGEEINFHEGASSHSSAGGRQNVDILRLPWKLSVALWGFDGGGGNRLRIDADSFMETLYAQVPERTPSCGLGLKRRPMHVSYDILYNVNHLPSEDLHSIESLISRSLVKHEIHDHMAYIELCPTFVDEFSKLATREFLSSSSVDSSGNTPRHTILFINPRKEKLRPEYIPKGVRWKYEYRHCGGSSDSSTSAQWVGQGRMVVSDLTATHYELGVQEVMPAIMRSELEAGTQNALRSVFLPNMAWCSGIDANSVDLHNKTVVPITVFKDVGVNERDRGLHRWTRPSLVRKSLVKFLDPEHRLSIGSRVFDITRKGQIAATFYDSIQTKSTFSPDEYRNSENPRRNRRFKMQHRSYIDGDMLLDRLQDSVGMLTSEVFPDGTVMGKMISQDGRIVPVFVFVLDEKSDNLKFQNNKSIFITQDAIAAVHGSSESLGLLHDRLVAALSTSLFGVLGPWTVTEERSILLTLYASANEDDTSDPQHSKSTTSYSTALSSQVVIDAALRNMMLSRADAALATIGHAESVFDSFERRHLGFNARHQYDYKGEGSFHTKSTMFEPIGSLRARLTDFRKTDALHFANELSNTENILQFHSEAKGLFKVARRLYFDAVAETENTVTALSCCALHFTYQNTTGQMSFRRFLIAGVLFCGMVLVVSYWLWSGLDQNREKAS